MKKFLGGLVGVASFVMTAGILFAAFSPAVPGLLRMAAGLVFGCVLLFIIIMGVEFVRLIWRAIRGDGRKAWIDFRYPNGKPFPARIPTPVGWQRSRDGEESYWDGKQYTVRRKADVGWLMRPGDSDEWYWNGKRYTEKRPIQVGWHEFPYAGVEAYWFGHGFSEVRPIDGWIKPDSPTENRTFPKSSN